MVTWHLTMKMITAKCREWATLQKLWDDWSLVFLESQCFLGWNWGKHWDPWETRFTHLFPLDQQSLTHWLLSQPWLAITSIGLCSTSDVITFDQNCHHLCSRSVGGKDLSNDTQIRVIGSMEFKICPKMLKNMSGKCRAKFTAVTLEATVKIAVSILSKKFLNWK